MSDHSASLPALMTPREVAAAARVEVDTVHKWASRGVLPHVKLGKLLRFRREQVRAWLTGEGQGS
jgi:excisionase family DNA binding protein